MEPILRASPAFNGASLAHIAGRAVPLLQTSGLPRPTILTEQGG